MGSLNDPSCRKLVTVATVCKHIFTLISKFHLGLASRVPLNLTSLFYQLSCKIT